MCITRRWALIALILVYWFSGTKSSTCYTFVYLHRAITMSTAPSLCRQRHHFRYFGPKSLSVTAPCNKSVHLLTGTTYAPIHMRKCTQQRFGKQKQHVYTTFCVFVPCAIWEKTCHKRSWPYFPFKYRQTCRQKTPTRYYIPRFLNFNRLRKISR